MDRKPHSSVFDVCTLWMCLKRSRLPLEASRRANFILWFESPSSSQCPQVRSPGFSPTFLPPNARKETRHLWRDLRVKGSRTAPRGLDPGVGRSQPFCITRYLGDCFGDWYHHLLIEDDSTASMAYWCAKSWGSTNPWGLSRAVRWIK